jgi:PAS domain S-box-containing protein
MRAGCEEDAPSLLSLTHALGQARAYGRELEAREAALRARLEALADEDARLRCVAQNLPGMVALTDGEGHPTHLYGNVMGITGYAPDELLCLAPHERWQLFLTPHDVGALQSEMARLQSGLLPSPLRCQVHDKAGELRWVSAHLTPLHDDALCLVGYQVALGDISERVQAERVMRSLEAASGIVQQASVSVETVLATLTEQLAGLGLYSVVGLLDEGQQTLALVSVRLEPGAREAIERLFSKPLSVMQVPVDGAPILRRVVRDRATETFALSERTLVELFPPESAWMGSALGGLVPIGRGAVAPLVVEDQVLGVLAVGGEQCGSALLPALTTFANQAAIALRNAELVRELRRSEKQHRGIFEAAQNGLLVVDARGTVLAANPAAARLFGAEGDALCGRALDALLGPGRPELLSEIAQHVQRDGQYSCTAQGISGDGTMLPVELHASQLVYQGRPHLLLVIADISERVQAEQALLSAERLRALGQMAGGIAHDFNNILVGIRGYADLALLDLEENAAMLREDLAHILAGANDAAEAVRRLQSLYRQADDTSDFALVQLDQIVADAVALTQPRWKDQLQALGLTIRMETHLVAPEPVLGNAAELRRVLTNLIINALDAMPRGGTLAVSTREDPGWSVLTVRDSGIGIAPEQQQRVFDPFFSTKNSSGLGLTVSKNIVERHGGSILVHSQPGPGTEFVVRLPWPTPARPSITSGALLAQPEALCIRLKVLVVDDEEAVRALLERLFVREGQAVTCVSSGREAIAALQSQAYDLLVTDLGMPDVSGYDVALQAHALRPDMPVILTTGWGETITPERLKELHAAALLSKPFTHTDLREAMDRAMSAD